MENIEILLVDANETIFIHAAKNILDSCAYFHNLFSFGVESTQSSIKIIVANAQIARDVINSLDNPNIIFTDSKYLLEIYKCRSFFCLDNDVKQLYNIIVQPNEFELLLQVIEEFDFINDECLFRTIKNNIPEDYDLNNFSPEFINELLKLKDYMISFGGDNGCITIWNTSTNQIFNPIKENIYSIGINSLGYSTDNLKLVSVDQFSTIKIWDTATNKLINSWSSSFADITQSAVLSPNNLNIVSCNSHNIKIWDVETGKLINTLKGHSGVVFSVNYSADNKKIVSGSTDNTIKIWDAYTGKILYTLYGFGKTNGCVVFSPDCLKIASSIGANNTINIWDSQTYKLLYTLRGHTKIVRCIAFSPDNSKIVSSGHDNSIKIWNAQTYQLLNTFNDNTGSVRTVVFTPDSLKIVSGDYGGNVKLWDLKTGRCEKNTICTSCNIYINTTINSVSVTYAKNQIDDKLDEHIKKIQLVTD